MRFARIFLALLLALATVQVMAMPDGRALYQLHCSACHQFEGSGGIGLPLVKKKLDDVSDEYLFKSIRYGRPGRVMPAYQEMSDAQVNAIVRYMRERSGSIEKVYDPAPLTGDLEHGAALFEEHCVKCHGDEGTGEGKGTGVTLSRERSFLVMPSSVANAGFLDSVTDRQMHHIISVGREDSDMPGYTRKGLSEEDINALVVYVRKLGSEAGRPDPLDPEEPLTNVTESPYDFETTVNNAKAALAGANFRNFPDRFLEQGLIDEFSVNQRQVAIRFCNFAELYGMLKVEPRLGVVLPCRVTIMERADGSVILVTPNLRVVSRWFNNDELVELWESMEENLQEIIEEATL
jgi:cytochrome c oxidase cbb3-type subunit 3